MTCFPLLNWSVNHTDVFDFPNVRTTPGSFVEEWPESQAAHRLLIVCVVAVALATGALFSPHTSGTWAGWMAAGIGLSALVWYTPARHLGWPSRARKPHGQGWNRSDESYRETVQVLICAMEARDGETMEHCQRISGWAERMARQLNASEDDVAAIRLAALLHDVGKIAIPDAILFKAGPLTDQEWAVMRQHPAIGEAILAPAQHLAAVAPLVGSHHERWDGSGYPRGLVSKEIPLGARIIAVADAYSAMTDQRVYRKTLAHDEAMAELQRGAGRLFDPAIVALFEELMMAEAA